MATPDQSEPPAPSAGERAGPSRARACHAVPVGVYLAIFAALMVLTAATVAVARVDLGALNNVVALGIATVKAVLVVLWFMHVRYSSRLTWVFVAAGFFWLFLLIAGTMHDYASRHWL